MKPQQCSDDAPPNAPLNTLNVYLHFSPMELHLLTRINSSTCCSSLRHVSFSCHWLDRERFPVEDLYQLYIDWFIDWFVDWLIDWLTNQWRMEDWGVLVDWHYTDGHPWPNHILASFNIHACEHILWTYSIRTCIAIILCIRSFQEPLNALELHRLFYLTAPASYQENRAADALPKTDTRHHQTLRWRTGVYMSCTI